jgi:hypothetical protein
LHHKDLDGHGNYESENALNSEVTDSAAPTDSSSSRESEDSDSEDSDSDDAPAEWQGGARDESLSKCWTLRVGSYLGLGSLRGNRDEGKQKGNPIPASAKGKTARSTRKVKSSTVVTEAKSIG